MFPEDFWWGVSESGFQFEMGDPDGKYIDQNTDWYKWVHDDYNIRNKLVSGDLPENGIDYFSKYSLDHKIAKEIGLNTFRIGVEWSRIFPNPTNKIEVDVDWDKDGRVDKVKIDDKDIQELDKIANKKALKHYRKIIMDLKNKGFNIIVCLNHFTLPLWIHDPIKARDTKLRDGPLGWLDNNIVIEFTKYAAYIAHTLGDLVDMWATLNEPIIVAEAGYLKMETFPPYHRDMGFPPRLRNSAFAKAIINMIYAHVNAYEAIKKWCRVSRDSNKKPLIGIIHNMMPIQPYRKDKEIDIMTAKFLSHIHNTLILDAITRGWLDKNFNGKVDRDEHIPRLANHLDWLGINYYCRVVVKGGNKLLAKITTGLPAFFYVIPGYGFTAGELNQQVSLDGYPVTDIGWEIYPQGLKQVIDIASKYNKPILITENGLADAEDKYRAQFLVTHLKTLDDIIEDGNKKIFGYLHWALTDNYEWSHGFKMKFGLYYVDLKTKERIPRPSVKIYKQIIEENYVNPELLSKYSLNKR